MCQRYRKQYRKQTIGTVWLIIALLVNCAATCGQKGPLEQADRAQPVSTSVSTSVREQR